MPETGPREVAVLARAFNDLQDRLARSIEDRTHALAAVSHDLKTPITRLRFRTEEIDMSLSRGHRPDLDEMERMIDQTLSYLRGDRSDEAASPGRSGRDPGDRDRRSDRPGRRWCLSLVPRAAVVQGRRLGLEAGLRQPRGQCRQVWRNRPRRGLRTRAGCVVVIDDDGQGIAAEDRDRVLLPFVRLERSRNTETGGFGLGLTIARAVIDGHGGTLELGEGGPVACG